MPPACLQDAGISPVNAPSRGLIGTATALLAGGQDSRLATTPQARWCNCSFPQQDGQARTLAGSCPSSCKHMSRSALHASAGTWVPCFASSSRGYGACRLRTPPAGGADRGQHGCGDVRFRSRKPRPCDQARAARPSADARPEVGASACRAARASSTRRRVDRRRRAVRPPSAAAGGRRRVERNRSPLELVRPASLF